MLKYVFLTALSMTLLFGCESSGDRLHVPVPSADRYVAMELTSLHATSSRDLVVGGVLTTVDGDLEGILLRSADGGTSWRRMGAMTYPFEGFLPQTIYFNDLLRGWVSGLRVRRGETIPVVLRTDDGGGHWREAEIPESRAAVVVSAAELFFESDGAGEVQVTYMDEDTGATRTNLYESRDGGRSWILGKFMDEKEPQISDPSRFFYTEKEGFRLDPPLANGTQILHFTGSGGETWVPRCQFHLSQFSQYY